MLMAIEDLYTDFTENDMNDEDVVVDMEGELISALEEIDRLRLKKRKQKQLLIQYENNDKEPSTDCILVKIELEEGKKIEDSLKQQLAESKSRCENLEEEVVTVRKELEKFQALYQQNLPSIKASKELNNILSKQRSPLIKSGLGYEQGSSSSHSKNKEFTKSATFIKAEANKNNSNDNLMN